MTLIANFLTLLRIFAIPFIIWGFFIGGYKGAEIVLILFLIASITDYLDGFIARKFNASSRFGAMLDPIADKLLVAVVLILLVYDQPHPGQPRADLIPVLIIICREILVSGLREFLALERIAMPVTGLAKWKTTFQFLAVLCLLTVPLMPTFHIKNTNFDTHQIGQILLWIAALFTFITGWQYSRHTLKEGFKGKKLLEIKLITSEKIDERK